MLLMRLGACAPGDASCFNASVENWLLACPRRRHLLAKIFIELFTCFGILMAFAKFIL